MICAFQVVFLQRNPFSFTDSSLLISPAITIIAVESTGSRQEFRSIELSLRNPQSSDPIFVETR